MPLTPFHWGPALLIGLVFFPLLNIPILLVSSVIIDVEPFLMNLQHLFLHSYLGATIAGMLVALAAIPLKKSIEWISAHIVFLPQKATLRGILGASLVGVWLHVFLDSFLYPEMKPFFPFDANPFLYLVASTTIYEISFITLPIAAALYFIRIYLIVRRRGIEQKEIAQNDSHSV